MASKVIYKGVVYGDGVKQVELNTTIKNPLEMDLTDEQIAGEEPLDIDTTYDTANAKLTMNLDIPSAMVIANGVVVTDDQKEKYVYTESEEVQGVITDRGYKLVYGTLGQRFVWKGMRVLFGKSNFDQDYFKTYYPIDRSSDNTYKYRTEQGENINTVYYTTGDNMYSSLNWPTIDGYYYSDAFYEDEEHTIPITLSNTTFYKDLHTNDIYRKSSTTSFNLYLCRKRVNLIAPGDNVTIRTRVTPADRAAIAAGTNEVEKRYIFNFITKDDLYDYVPISGNANNSYTWLYIKEKNSDYTLYTIYSYYTNDPMFTVKIPSTADTVGFFLWSQHWNSSGPGVGIGLAAFEGDDLIAFVPVINLGYVWHAYSQSNGQLIREYEEWRTYYKYATTNIIEGTYISNEDFEDTNGVHYKTDQPFGSNLFHDTTTNKYYMGNSNQNKLQEVKGIVRINEDKSVLTTRRQDNYSYAGGPETELSGSNSPEYRYAAGLTAKLSYVSKAEWEKASGHDIDDGE